VFLVKFSDDSTFIRWSNICALVVAVILLVIFIWQFYTINAVFVEYYKANGDDSMRVIKVVALIISLLEVIRIPLKIR
jgi:hypothetical protein